MNFEVSIVILVYNAEDVLRPCLESVVNQTFKQIEIICINDGSTDDSPNILNDYANRDSRIRIIHQQNAGQYPTRNVGLRHIRGRYMLFVDCDDLVEPDLVEKAFYRAEAEQADITLIGWKYLLTPDKSPDVSAWNLRSWRNGKVNARFPMGFGYVWMKLYSKEFLDSHQLRFREEFYTKADVIFHWKSMSLAERVSVVPEPLYHYRVHENSITGTIGKRFIQVIHVMEAIKADLEDMCDPKGLLPSWYPFAFNFIYGAYQQISPEYRPEMEDELRRFLADLTPHEKCIYRQNGHLPKKTRCFYLSLESPSAAFYYGTLFRTWKAATSRMRSLILPPALKKKLLEFVRRQSYTLSRSSVEDLQNTVAEQTEVANRLAAENYRLKQRLRSCHSDDV
jgi:glycosyltransferase involved in cell wall biosynthesis